MKNQIIKTVFLTITALAVIAVSSYAVPTPLMGAATPGGRYIYVPDMTNNRIRVIDSNLVYGAVNISSDASSPAVIQNFPVPGDPYCLTVNAAGTRLFATINNIFPNYSYIIACTIEANGTLTPWSQFQMPDMSSAPRGCVISPNGNYLYVADSYPFPADGTRLRVINISNPGAMSQVGYVPVVGTNMPIYGVAVNPSANLLYVSVNHSNNGQVLVFNIATQSSPSYSMTLAGCPQASTLKVSTVYNYLFVKVLERVSPWTDVRVYNATTGAFIRNLSIPSPGNHQISKDLNGDGWDDDPANTDFDISNDDAGMDLSPDGKYIYYTHYIGRSGRGFWFWNIKVRCHPLSDLSQSWEAGGGYHSADSMVFAGNRRWQLYSDGGFAQSTAFLGPNWVDHFNATSNEASVIWDPVINNSTYLASFEIQYVRVIDIPGFQTKTVIATSEYRFKDLTYSSTYEVRVRAIAPNGDVSDWVPATSGSGHTFYTHETVWVSHYITSTNEAVIIFGPLISRGTKFVPYSERYDLYYRKVGDPDWIKKVVSKNQMDDPSQTDSLSYRLTGLTENVTYEVKMRSIDWFARWSDWSAIDTFVPSASLWINAYNPGRNYAWIEWGSSNGATDLTNVVTYEMQYKRAIDSLWINSTAPLSSETWEDAGNANHNFHFTGNAMDLTDFTTYEVRIRGKYAGGAYSNWSNTDQFFTWWMTAPAPTGEVGGPRWVSHYNVMANSAYLDCEDLFNPAAQYEIQYKPAAGAWISTGLFTQATRSNTAESNPNKYVSGLVASTNYEVRARAYNGTYYSDWCGSDFFYTLERPWLDWYAASTAGDVYLAWGPELSPGVYVPNATGYQWRYRVNGGAWATSTEVLDATKRDDPAHNTASDTLSFKWRLIQANSSYEAQMRSRDASGGVSDWSSSVIIRTGPPSAGVGSPPLVFQPWIGNYNTTPDATVIQWGWAGAKPAGIDHYVMSFSTNEGASWQDLVTPLLDSMHSDATNLTNPTYLWTGLTPLSTYEVIIKAVDSGGAQIGNNSSVITFHTFWQLWTDKYHVGNTSAYIMWGPTVPAGLDHYVLQYKKAVDAAWTDYPGPTTPLNNSAHAISDLGAVLNASLEAPQSALTPSTTYEVRMKAVHTSGFEGDWSTTLTFITVRGPWWADVKNVTYTSATIVWENLLPGITQYEVSYSTNPSAEGAGMPVAVSGTTEYNTPSTLTPNTWYYAKVRSVVGGVRSDWTTIVPFYTAPWWNGPGWISNFSTTTTSTGLTWDAASGTGSYEVSYGTTTEATGSLEAPSPLNQNSIPAGGVSGLTERTWYYTMVRSHSGSMAGRWSPIAAFFTIPAPNNVLWTGSTATTASITWDAVHLDTLNTILCTSYEVSWGLDANATGSGDAMTSNIFYTMTGLDTGLTYYVKVRARDDARSGWSSWTPYPTLAVVTTGSPVINSIDGSSGYRGTTILIRGINFGATTGTVTIGGVAAQPGYWKNNEIAVAVPPTAPTGVNSIVVVTSGGVTATHTGVGAPYTFNVYDGGWVLEDYEGGAWEFATWQAGAGNSITYAKAFDASVPERNTYVTAEVKGTANYEIFGGVSPYGDQPTESGFSLAGDNKLYLKIRNDGVATITATFELVEANTAPGNDTGNPLAAEVWKYNVPIVVPADGVWHTVSINLTTEGTASFELDTAWYSSGGIEVLSFDQIKSFQILTSGGNPKRYSVDYVMASNETGALTGSKIYDIRYIDELNSDNWIAIPFSGTGITNSFQLAQSIGQAPTMTPQEGDFMLITVRDNATQSYNQGMAQYTSGAWTDLLQIPINAGDSVSLVISNLGRPQINGLWTVSGNILPVGSGNKQYSIRYVDELNSNNWLVDLDNIYSASITNSFQLAQSIGQAPAMTPQEGDFMLITVRDNATQTYNQGMAQYTSGAWTDLLQIPIAKNDLVSVVISNAGRPSNNGLWP